MPSYPKATADLFTASRFHSAEDKAAGLLEQF